MQHEKQSLIYQTRMEHNYLFLGVVLFWTVGFKVIQNFKTIPDFIYIYDMKYYTQFSIPFKAYYRAVCENTNLN